MTGVQDHPEPGKTGFALTMEKAWREACTTYLTESGLKEDSEEWIFIMETEHFSQIIDVVNETWADYNNPVGQASSAPASSPQFVITSSTHIGKKIDFKAKVKRGFNRAFGKKESGKIFLQPQFSPTAIEPSYIDQHLQLEKKLSGRPSSARNAIEMGLQLTDQTRTMERSENIKTVVATVLQFTDGLHSLVSVSELVSSVIIHI